jgi:hypothetical protein
MPPVIDALKAAHNLADVTVVADAEMISEANQVALQASTTPSACPSTICRPDLQPHSDSLEADLTIVFAELGVAH